MKISKSDLENRVTLLNQITGMPVVPYSMVDGRYQPNAGCYLLDWAYGGVKLSRMSSKDGCTGQSNPISMGFSTKKECYRAVNHFISGIETGKELAK